MSCPLQHKGYARSHRRAGIGRIKAQAGPEPCSPFRCEVPVFTFDVMHHRAAGPGQEGRHDKSRALARRPIRNAAMTLAAGATDGIAAPAGPGTVWAAIEDGASASAAAPLDAASPLDSGPVQRTTSSPASATASTEPHRSDEALNIRVPPALRSACRPEPLSGRYPAPPGSGAHRSSPPSCHTPSVWSSCSRGRP